MKIYGKRLLLLLLAPLILLSFINVAYAQTCSNEQQCSELIQQYTDQIVKLQGQASTLKNQIAQFDAQIKLTTLKIIDTQNKIALLGGRIDQLEVSLNDLTLAFSSRAVETYKLSKFERNFSFILSSSDINDAVARFHYLAKIQEADRSLLEKLQEAQTTYIGEKESQETLQAELKKQEANLNSQKAAKNSLLTATKNDESKYQSLLSQAKAQLAAFSRFVAGQGGASILTGQTKCDSWGCYYNQRDSSWGNMSMGGSPYSMASYGCLVTSVSMVASHYGKNIKPNDIAANSDAFVPGTGYLYHDFSVNGIKVTVSSASKSIIDGELAAGRPVIAGLYSGPDHFIVITRKEGDKYIMRDPFMENGAGSDGSGRPLTDNYDFSAITSLRLVSFN
jgi:peptidoglycan hydrolase CwlO-like protein